MQGAENTKGFILGELYDKVKSLDREGGVHAQLTREKVDNLAKCHDTLQVQFSTFMRAQGQMQTGITILCVLTSCLALMAGGTLVWNIVKAFAHI